MKDMIETKQKPDCIPLLSYWVKNLDAPLLMVGMSAETKEEMINKAIALNPKILPSEVNIFREEVRIDEARQILDEVSVLPVYRHIVVFAGGVNEAAQNALLKSVEEDRKTAYVFFADREEDVLMTIRSRCRILRITPDTKDAFSEFETYATAFYAACRGDLVYARRLDASCGSEIRRMYDAIKANGLARFLIEKGILEEKQVVFGEELMGALYNMVLYHAWEACGSRIATTLDQCYRDDLKELGLNYYLLFEQEYAKGGVRYGTV